MSKGRNRVRSDSSIVSSSGKYLSFLSVVTLYVSVFLSSSSPPSSFLSLPHSHKVQLLVRGEVTSHQFLHSRVSCVCFSEVLFFFSLFIIHIMYMYISYLLPLSPSLLLYSSLLLSPSPLSLSPLFLPFLSFLSPSPSFLSLSSQMLHH